VRNWQLKGLGATKEQVYGDFLLEAVRLKSQKLFLSFAAAIVRAG